MQPIRLRAALVALSFALVASLAVASPVFDALRGLSIDLLTALRWRAFGNAHPPQDSPAVVVALDEETFRTPPFEGTPSVTWTREIGRVLTAVVDGGARVVGFDIIFPTSIEQSQVPFGDETLGARVRGFDRDYLRALALAARAGKLVLGQVQHQDKPVLPSAGQRAAVRQGLNIRPLNVLTDPDDVIRRLPGTFVVDGAPVRSMAAELAARGIPAPSGDAIDPGLKARDAITLNFSGGSDDIPTYSLADLRACAEQGDTDFFRRHFGGRIVLFGTVLDVEDRRITSKRFATAPERPQGARCRLPRPDSGERFRRASIPGVYIHATAVNNLLRGDALREPDRPAVALATFALAALAALAAVVLGPATAVLALLGGAAVWTLGATFAFRHAVALPLIEPVLAALAALGITIAYRFVVADRDKRLLRQSFALYLTPAVIERMMASNRLPALGGETRHITVYFSDIENFSTFAERVSPTELIAAINEYLSAMTDIIEANGGFVDKYMGDAIVAVFGAPLDDPRHAVGAVRAALQCAARLPSLARFTAVFGGETARQRIGLNSGDALVGNIGSRRRFNYTAMGDTVNLASRLEGANKAYGTTIMASEATRTLTGDAFAWRELDTIRVKGRAGSFRVFEPLAASDAVPPEQAALAETYAEGLARFRARDFAAAARIFSRSAADDPPAAALAARAAQLARRPPGIDWDGTHVLDERSARGGREGGADGE